TSRAPWPRQRGTPHRDRVGALCLSRHPATAPATWPARATPQEGRPPLQRAFLLVHGDAELLEEREDRLGIELLRRQDAARRDLACDQGEGAGGRPGARQARGGGHLP